MAKYVLNITWVECYEWFVKLCFEKFFMNDVSKGYTYQFVNWFMKNCGMIWEMSCEMCSFWWTKFRKIMHFVLWNQLLVSIVDLIVGIGGFRFGAQYHHEPIGGLVGMHIGFR